MGGGVTEVVSMEVMRGEEGVNSGAVALSSLRNATAVRSAFVSFPTPSVRPAALLPLSRLMWCVRVR